MSSLFQSVNAMAYRLRSSGQKVLGEVTFSARMSFSPGLLPTKKEVLEVMIFHLLQSPGRCQMKKSEAAALVGSGLMEHWVFQNVYTVQRPYINKKILALYDQFTALKMTSKQKQTPTWQENKLQPFLTSIKECLDISCKNEKAVKKLEKVYGVKMTKVEEQFLEDQLGPRLMLCTTEVDR